jgi:pimeloyl-ACP methyl ester carboxylesterase
MFGERSPRPDEVTATGTVLEGGARADVVVVLEGSSGSRSLRDRLLPVLAARFRVVAPPPPASAASVRRLLAHLGVERFAVVGHGPGAGIAQLLAVEGGVGALVLLDALAEDGSAVAADRDALAGLDVPVLLIWGEEDARSPVAGAYGLQDLLPDAALALLPGCSHDVIEDAPGTVVPLIDGFLRSRYAGERHGHTAGPVPLALERRRPRGNRAERTERGGGWGTRGSS